VLRVQRSIIPGGGLGIAGPLEQTNMMMPAKVKQ
jgi:exopolysaccharide production protein ExoF